MGGQRLSGPARLPHRRTGTPASRTAARLPRRGPPGQSARWNSGWATPGGCRTSGLRSLDRLDREDTGQLVAKVLDRADDTRPGAPGVRTYPRQCVLHRAARAPRHARRQPARAPAHDLADAVGGEMEDPERPARELDETRRAGRRPRRRRRPAGGRAAGARRGSVPPRRWSPRDDRRGARPSLAPVGCGSATRCWPTCSCSPRPASTRAPSTPPTPRPSRTSSPARARPQAWSPPRRCITMPPETSTPRSDGRCARPPRPSGCRRGPSPTTRWSGPARCGPTCPPRCRRRARGCSRCFAERRARPGAPAPSTGGSPT